MGDPGSLDPHKSSTVVEANVLAELFEGLTVYDAGGMLRPGVAAAWTQDEGDTVYRFTLRPEARWSNGDAVTADDFVFALRRLMNPATGAEYANILYTLKNAAAVNRGEMPADALGAVAPDPATLVLTLERPVPYFLDQLAHQTALPLHRASVERYGESFVRPGRLVGNGAFVLRDFMPNDRLVLARNPHYREAAAVALDGEVFLPLEDRAAALRRFMAGEIHSYDDVPIDQIAFVRGRLGAAFRVTPSLATYYYVFDTGRPPFDDPRLRQALSMTVDRAFLADKIWGGTMAPALGFVPPGIPSYGAPAAPDWAGLDPLERDDMARRLLDAAGFGPTRRLSLTFRYNTSENHKATAVAIADMWKPLGVDMELFNTDSTSHYAYLRAKRPFDIARSGWVGDFPDAQNFLFLLESDNPGLNDANWSDASFDRLMAAAGAEANPTARRDLLHRAEARLLAAQPCLPLLTYRSRSLVAPRLQGWQANVIERHPGAAVRLRA